VEEEIDPTLFSRCGDKGPTRVPSCGCDRDWRVCRAWGCGVAAAPSAAQMGEVGHPVRSREDVGDGRYGIVR
jgi:hypothetical protein